MKIQSDFIKNWLDEKVLSIEQASFGSTCDTYTIKTVNGQYVLRGQSLKEQVEQETFIFKALKGKNITSEIIQTFSGEYSIEKENLFYNLQTFIPGKMANLSDERQIKAAAETTAKFHNVLSENTRGISKKRPFFYI